LYDCSDEPALALGKAYPLPLVAGTFTHATAVYFFGHFCATLLGFRALGNGIYAAASELIQISISLQRSIVCAVENIIIGALHRRHKMDFLLYSAVFISNIRALMRP
jgi:hypothetical protein